MKENVRKELDTIEMMVLRWKKSYLEWATGDGGNDYLVEEFSEEISTHVSPLIRRLYETNHLTLFEHHEFMESCYNQLNDLRDLIKVKESENKQPQKSENKQPQKGIWA